MSFFKAFSIPNESSDIKRRISYTLHQYNRNISQGNFLLLDSSETVTSGSRKYIIAKAKCTNVFVRTVVVKQLLFKKQKLVDF